MKEHYEAVLKNMEEQERKIEASLAKIKAARLAILALMEDIEPESKPLFKYAGMGTREAILLALQDATRPLNNKEIEELLRDGGIRTNSSDFLSVIVSTLARMKKMDEIRRVEDGWVLPNFNHSTSIPILQQQPALQ